MLCILECFRAFQFAKLARDLVIPGGMRTRTRQEASGGGTERVEPQEVGGATGGASGANGPIQLDDEELEEGFL